MKVKLGTVIILSVVFAFFLALISYINSTFLGDLFGSENTVNLLYSIGGVVSLVTLGILARSRGVKVSLMILLGVTVVSLATLLFSKTVTPATWVAAILYLGISTGLIYLMDLLIEAKTPEDATGSIRGRYLAFQNAAWILAPLCAGFLVSSFGNTIIYYIGISISAVLILFVGSWKRVPNTNSENQLHKLTFAKQYHRIQSYAQALILNMFYAVMIIVTPVYLHAYAGWSWQIIGLAFTLMLIMFPVIQNPLGIWLDTHFRHYQSVSSAALTVMAVACMGIFLLAPVSIPLGIIMLVISRIGAAAVEIVSDTQFFITTDGHDRTPIAWYRSLTPISYIVAPLLVYAVHSEHLLVFSGLALLLSITAIFCAISYEIERSRRSLTIKPSSK